MWLLEITFPFLSPGIRGEVFSPQETLISPSPLNGHSFLLHFSQETHYWREINTPRLIFGKDEKRKRWPPKICLLWQLSNKLLISWVSMSRIRIDMICQNWDEENHILIILSEKKLSPYHHWQCCNTILQWLKVRCKFPSLHFLPLTALLIANWLLRHFSQIYFTFGAEQFLFLHLASLSSVFLSNVCAMVFYLPENYSSPCSICFWWPVHTPLAFMAQQFGSAQLAKHTHPFLFVF